MSRTLILALFCLSSLSAQSPVPQGLEITPGRLGDGLTDAVLWSTTSTHEGLVYYPSEHFQGIGDVTGTGGNLAPCEINGVYMLLHDVNDSTSDQFQIICRDHDLINNQPNIATFRWAYNVTGPTVPAGTTPGESLWGFTVSLPATDIPCTGGFYYGMRIVPNANWMNQGPPNGNGDGLSFIGSFYDPIGASYQSGDHPHPGAPNLTWVQLDLITTNVLGNSMTLFYNLLSDAPSLQIGAIHPTGTSHHSSDIGFGVAGLYPVAIGSALRQADGLAVRITDNPAATAGGFMALYLAVDTLADLAIDPLPLDGLSGRVYLGLTTLPSPIYTGFIGGSGDPDTIIPLVAPGSLPADVTTLGLNGYLQAYTVTNGLAHLTNMVGIKFLP